MKNIGIYGGTFNPIHNGHLYMAEQMAKVLGLECVLIIPANIPPHKTRDFIISGEHRLKMCSLACADNPIFEVSDIEVRRQGRSYTIDTLREVCNIYPNSSLSFLMGSDSFLSIRKWMGFQEIICMASLCTVPRSKQDLSRILKMEQALKEEKADIKIFDIPMKNISSSEIRKRIYKGLSIENMVPGKVKEYIKEKKLYTREAYLI